MPSIFDLISQYNFPDRTQTTTPPQQKGGFFSAFTSSLKSAFAGLRGFFQPEREFKPPSLPEAERIKAAKEFWEPAPEVRIRDILRETPEAIRRVGEVGAKFITEALQFTARTGGATALTLAQLPEILARKAPLPREIRPEGRPFWEQVASRVVFGNEPVKDWATIIAESEVKIRQTGQQLKQSENLDLKRLGEMLETGALPIAGLGIPFVAALDFTGVGKGGRAAVVSALRYANTTEDALRILLKINVPEDLARPAAEKFAQIFDPKLVDQGLAKIEELARTTKLAQTAAKPVAEVAPKITPELQPLAKQAEVTPPARVVPEVPPTPTVPKGFEWRERGFITSVKEALPELKVSGQYVPRSTDRLAIKAKTLIQTDIKTAERVAMTRTDDDAVAIGAELLKYYSDEAARATNEVVKDTLYEKAGSLANDMARKLTEQGRSVQAASILGRLTPEGQLKFAARDIQRFNEEVVRTRGGILGLQKKIPELTGEQSKHIINEMKAINEMAEGTEKAMRFQELQNYVSDLVPTPLFKKMIAVWKAGLLTGIKTSGLNIFANVSHTTTEIVKDIPATIVDKVVSIFTGKRAVTISLEGVPVGIKEGLEKGQRYLMTGFDERNIGAKLDYKRVNFGKGKLAQGLQAYTNVPFRLMGAEDQPFYYAAKLRSLYEQAKVGAINKGLKGAEAQKFIDDLIQNPTEEMIKYASIDAETAVFQNKTLLGQAARGIQKTGIGEIIVPFGRTPSAVAMQIVNYSPVGIPKTIIENLGRGRFDQRLFSQGMGRALTGTSALVIGGLLFKEGMITLDRPTGEKEQKLWELEGKKPNSIYDPIMKKWRSVQVLGPWGNVLLIGGHYQNAFDKSGSPTEAMVTTLAGASKSFTEQTFLTGVSSFIDAISDPARSAESVAGSTLASAIPTIVSDIARADDNRERRANTIFEKFQARIPGVRETLEPQITVLGEEREAVGNPLEIMIDPTRPSPAKSTPVIEELRRLWDVGFKVSPTLLGDKKGYPSLTKEQNTQLWKKAGEITNEKLTNLIKLEAYQKLPDDEKAKNVENVVDKTKLNARAGMVLELIKDLKGEELKKKLSELKKSGLMTREVYNKWLELR